MTRKHYVEVAEIIRDAIALAEGDDAVTTAKQIAVNMAIMFRRDNPRFDAGRFYAAINKV
jgi:hypothetical protein